MLLSATFSVSGEQYEALSGEIEKLPDVVDRSGNERDVSARSSKKVILTWSFPEFRRAWAVLGRFRVSNIWTLHDSTHGKQDCRYLPVIPKLLSCCWTASSRRTQRQGLEMLEFQALRAASQNYIQTRTSLCSALPTGKNLAGAGWQRDLRTDPSWSWRWICLLEACCWLSETLRLILDVYLCWKKLSARICTGFPYSLLRQRKRPSLFAPHSSSACPSGQFSYANLGIKVCNGRWFAVGSVAVYTNFSRANQAVEDRHTVILWPDICRKCALHGSLCAASATTTRCFSSLWSLIWPLSQTFDRHGYIWGDFAASGIVDGNIDGRGVFIRLVITI